jgi:hypothetical protein
MKGTAMTRFLLFGLLCLIFIGSGMKSLAQEMMTLDQQKQLLIQEGKGRDLSQLTHEELARLKEGGPISERVVRIGLSTFILNLGAIYTLAAFSFFVITMFFTPIGFWLFRGNLHAFIGSILKASGISKGPDSFGESLTKDPKHFMVEYKSVRQAFAMYMHKKFIRKYKNNITAIAFMGTAFLIFAIGVRGLKFIVAHQPGLILYAILVEVTVLLLLGLTTWFEKEQEDDEEDSAYAHIQGKQLSLEEVERKIEEFKSELEASVHSESRMRH